MMKSLLRIGADEGAHDIKKQNVVHEVEIAASLSLSKEEKAKMRKFIKEKASVIHLRSEFRILMKLQKLDVTEGPISKVWLRLVDSLYNIQRNQNDERAVYGVFIRTYEMHVKGCGSVA